MTILPLLCSRHCCPANIPQLNSQSESQSNFTTDGQSASLSWCQEPIWDFTVAGLFMWGALSEERTGLSFTMYNVQYIYILYVIT
jgi:hypothetical protein